MKKIVIGISLSLICALSINASDVGLDNIILSQSSSQEISFKNIPKCPKTLLVNFEPNVNNAKENIAVMKQQEICANNDEVITFTATSTAVDVGKKVDKKEYEDYISKYVHDVIKDINKGFTVGDMSPYTLILTVDARRNSAIAYIKKQKDKEDEYYIVLNQFTNDSLKHK